MIPRGFTISVAMLSCARAARESNKGADRANIFTYSTLQDQADPTTRAVEDPTRSEQSPRDAESE